MKYVIAVSWALLVWGGGGEMVSHILGPIDYGRVTHWLAIGGMGAVGAFPMLYLLDRRMQS